ncbi:MAG: 2,3-bisphosphoglycerate-independent phosphoglycerate mutase [Bacilli bacterium]|nr:2,3-bisphosphoglycerate-independent phosphoglycerate mutase [Bacilli bacterium]
MKKILMIILDGFGIRENEHGNAVKLANMTYFNSLLDKYPNTLLEASGEYVGLPEGQFGNSEVCHEVIGLGKKIKQKITVINEEIFTKRILENEEFNNLLETTKKNKSTIHLMGLTSDGGVHSHLGYVLKLISLLKEKGIKKIVFHAITDGRDTYIKSSLKFINEVDNLLRSEKLGFVGTICGRYYAMDRDNKWDRTQKYYDLVMKNKGFKVIDYNLAINNCYKKNITDEFLPPMLVTDDACIKKEDTLLWFNFRPDRARQILSALTTPDFSEFKTDFQVNAWNMFEVNDVTNIHTLFELPKENIYPIGKYFSDLKITQARIAETEKYSHVTYFFNAELSKKFPLCDNYLVESPKVPTYDQTPLMSATDVTRKVKSAINKNYDFILVNYANPDMLGHTGNLEATIESLKGLDKLLEYIVNYSIDNFYKVFILADHGNCDEMLTDNDEIITTHSLSKVPFIITDDNIKLKKSGDLTNVASTLLDYMDIAIPKEMEDAKSLIIKD